MNAYQKLLTKHYDTYWEDLSVKEKNNLVITYVLYQPIKIPPEVSFQQIVLNLLNPDVRLKDGDIYAKSVLFQSIKQQIEKDLEEEWMILNSIAIGQYEHY